jgi:hypothetical protein
MCDVDSNRHDDVMSVDHNDHDRRRNECDMHDSNKTHGLIACAALVQALVDAAGERDDGVRTTVVASLKDVASRQPLLVLTTCLNYLFVNRSKVCCTHFDVVRHTWANGSVRATTMYQQCKLHGIVIETAWTNTSSNTNISAIKNNSAYHNTSTRDNNISAIEIDSAYHNTSTNTNSNSAIEIDSAYRNTSTQT